MVELDESRATYIETKTKVTMAESTETGLDRLNELFIKFYRKVGVANAFKIIYKYVDKEKNQVIKDRAIVEVCSECDINKRDLFRDCSRDIKQRGGLITLFLVLKKNISL